MKLFWTPEAVRDREEIYEYISSDSLEGTSKSPFIRPPAADQARLVGMKAWGGR